jgi:hypothetical protein
MGRFAGEAEAVIAFGDESGSVASVDPGAYIFAGILLTPTRASGVREAIAALRRPSQKKIHWRDDADKRHAEVVQCIAALPISGLVIARVGPLSDRAERRRRKCLEAFLDELQSLGCHELTLESRGPHQDRDDMDLLNGLRAQRRLSSNLRVAHRAGPAEPLLWIADAVAGAYVAHRTGDSTYFAHIEGLTKVVEVQA